jgi:autotransporter-associated beta strand protein
MKGIAFGRHIISGIMASLVGLASGYGQQLAFPGAQGFGQYATGGRGGTVYHVTTLADSGSGSFRDAVGGANRTIVFDVGGYVVLNSAVSCANNLTIAGQTAPGDGIGIMGHEVSFSAKNNEIVRFLRFRPSKAASSTEDGINCGDGVNMIFDHISIEFAPYNNLDAHGNSGANTITLQNSILGDPTGQQFNQHAEAGGKTFAWCYNLFVNAHNRNPMAKVNDVFINNVVYNYQGGYTVADTSSHFTQDIVNNFFITGPSTTSAGDDFYQMDGNISAYSSGNLLDQNRDGNLKGSGTAPGSVVVLSAPWSALTTNTPTYSTVTAYKYDVSMAGDLPHDQVDQVVVSDAMSVGKSGRIYNSAADDGLGNNGFGTIDGGTALTDTDGDGMPDIWETANGSSPTVANNNTVAADGYTLLEHYLNWLAAPHAFVQTNATDIDLRPYTLGFTNGATYSVFNFTNCTATITNGHFAHFMPTISSSGLASFSFKVVDSAGSTVTNTMGLLVSVVYIPQNLVWVGNGASNPWDTTNTADWFNGNDLVTFHAMDNVTFDDTGSVSPAVNIASAAVSPGNLTVAADQNYTFNGGAINGAGSLTKSGLGTLTVNNANGFTGGTVIQNGSVMIGPGGSLGTGAITFQNTTLTSTYGATAFGLNNPLNVPPGESATLVLSANMSFGPATNGGTLNVTIPGTANRSDYVQGSWSPFTGTLNLTGTVPNALLDCHFNGGGSYNFDGGWGSATVNLDNVELVTHNGSGGNTLNIGTLNGTATASLGGAEYAGTCTYSVGGLNVDSTFAGSISNYTADVNNFIKVGTGNLTLSGTNHLNGTLTVSNGTLTVSGSTLAASFSIASGTLAGSGQVGSTVTIQSGAAIAPAGTLKVNSNLTLATPKLYFYLSSSPASGNDQILLLGGTLAMSGAQNYIFNLTDGTLGAGTYGLIEGATASSASGVSFKSNLPGNTRQAFNLYRASAGANPSYVRLDVTGTAASLLWLGTNGSAWDLGMTANWLNGSTADKFYNLDTVTFDDTSTNGLVTVSPYTGSNQPAFLIVSNNARNYTIGGGGIAGQTTVVKNGSGSLILSPYMVSTSTTIVNGSTTVTVASTNGIAPGQTVSGPHINAGTTVVAVPTSTTVTISQAATGSSTYTISYCAINTFTGGMIVNGGTLQFVNNPFGGGTGPIALNGATLYFNGVGTGTIITCAGTNTLQTSGQPYADFNLAGSGVLTVTLGSGGTFSPGGDWSQFSGTINFTTANWLRELNTVSFGSSNAVWNFGSNGGMNNKQGGANIYFGALFGGAGVVLGGGQAGYPVTTYIIGGVNTNSVFNGTISDGGLGTALIFNGPGLLTLTGTNNYSGGTMVNAGTLFVNNTAGSGTGTGVVTVNSGASLGGTGTIGGIVSVAAGAVLAPGGGNPGTLTITNDLSLDNASVMQFQLGANSDQVDLTGNLTLGGTLNISDAGGFGPGTYTLFNYGDALSIGTLTLGSTPAGYIYTIDTSVQGQVNLIVSLPQFGNIHADSNGLVMSGSGGAANAVYYLLISTNLATPPAGWTRVLTNQFDVAGNFTVTNPPATNSQTFYRLQLQ